MSTLSVELPGGEGWDVPGVVYTTFGLGGGMSSSYFLQAGAHEEVRWGDGDILIEVNPRSGNIVVDGGLDSITVDDGGDSLQVSMLEFDADTEKTEYGFYTGDFGFSVDSFSVAEGFQTVTVGPLSLESSSELNGDRLDSDMQMAMAMAGGPMGDMSLDLDATFDGWDAESVGRISKALQGAQSNPNPMMALASIEQDAANLVAAGLTISIDRLDVSLPQGTFLSKMELLVPEMDRDNFVWTSVLHEMEASADITIPSALFDMIAAMNPDAQMAVATGMLRPDGDNYVMVAQYKQGLLTVNGAPMPIPLPGG